MTSCNYCFTINNPDDTDQLNLSLLCTDEVKLCVYQLESGENETPHIQGYIEFLTPKRLAGVKQILGNRAHIERRNGTRAQALKYVTKEETRLCEPIYFNCREEDIKKIIEGKRKNLSSLDDIKALLDSGATELEIADSHFAEWCRYHYSFQRYILMKSTPRTTFDELIIIQGPTGTGKSHFCRTQFPKAYWKNNSDWWDGYNGEETIIIDEFYGWLKLDLLLRLCDKNPLLLGTKGGHKNCSATRVVITSNDHPKNWYRRCPEMFNSLKRRVSKWGFFKSLDEQTWSNNYTDFDLLVGSNYYNAL